MAPDGGGGGADKRHAYMRGSSPVAAGATVAAAQLRKETLREPLEVFAAFFMGVVMRRCSWDPA